MAQDTMVDSDFLTNLISDHLISDLNGRSLTVRAYHTSLNPTPATTSTTFAAEECIFDTYSPFPLTSAWQQGVQIQPGEWATVNGPVTWSAPLTISDVIVGLWVQDSFGNVYMSYEFSSPIPVTVGGPPIQFNLQHNQWARVLLPGPF